MKIQVTTMAFVLQFAGCAIAVQADEAFATRAGCIACHGVPGQGTGPTFDEIAARYQGVAEARAQLSERIFSGGKGNWDDVTGGLSMPPYSNLLSPEDIDTLIDFILARDQ